MKKLFALLLAMMMLLSFGVVVNAEPEDEGVEAPVFPAYEEYVIGNTITFGTYADEAIEWLVLDIEDGKALVISNYALDCQPYNTTYANVTWETCSLRKWLNETFLNAAFSAEEQAMIPTVTVKADKNADYLTDAGNDTEDRIFLLSITEAEQYLPTSKDKGCSATMHAEMQGAFVNNDTGNCWWWLRTPGHSLNVAAGVRVNGKVVSNGDDVTRKNAAVRPVMWIEMPADPSEPVEPEDPVEPSEPSEPEEPVVPDEPADPNDSPVTGETTVYLAGAVLLMVLAAAAALLTSKKRA